MIVAQPHHRPIHDTHPRSSMPASPTALAPRRRVGLRAHCLLLPHLAGWVAALALAAGAALAQDEIARPALVANPSFEQAGADETPAGWRAGNWGRSGTSGRVVRDATAAHAGEASVRAESLDDGARPGVYLHLPLAAGRYALRFFARAETGHRVRVRAYLGDRYGPPCLVGDTWTEVSYRHTLAGRCARAEINLQSLGGEPGSVWFDDLELVPLAAVQAEVVADTRDPALQPRLLYFGANLNYLRATAAEWVERGFAGFLCSHLMPGTQTDVWAVDRKPQTTGTQDRLFQEAQAAARDCHEAGLDDNALKVALQPELPDPFDDRAYARLCENLKQGARFARGAGLRLIALDTEYPAVQYEYAWKGYNLTQHPRRAIARKLRDRWTQVGRALAEAYPAAELAVLPEGMLYYGPLWLELFSGLLEGFDAGGGQGNIHLMCEGTYSLLDPQEIREHAVAVRATAAAALTGRAAEVWRQRGKLALGAWPLGYFRLVQDAAGKRRGWSGKLHTFGDKTVGAYADKTERYSLASFYTQFAAIRTISDRYCWVYGHGASWWQVNDKQAKQLGALVEPFPRDNYLLPTIPDIEAYYRVTSERMMVRFTGD